MKYLLAVCLQHTELPGDPKSADQRQAMGNFVLLTPGVTNDGTFGLVSFHGITGVFNNTMIDGADNNQAFFAEERGRT